MWESCQWLGVNRYFFAWYYGFLRHLQPASAGHDFAAILQKKWRKNQFPIQYKMVQNTWKINEYQHNRV